MTRGRPRKHDPSIPAHIDQAALPKGMYWDRSGNGRWYVLEDHPEGGKRKRTVATARARLSDLHSIVEQAAGGSARGTVDYVTGKFHDSTDFKALAPRTQTDYERYRAIASKLPTKIGIGFGTLQVSRLSPPVIQGLVESIAKQGHPTKANHLLRYLRRTFRWGMNHGACTNNPAAGVSEATEMRAVVVPDLPTYARVTAFAQQRGALMARTLGSCAPYLWICMEIAYLCRLRGIEVITLTDANLLESGVKTNRRKGSRDTIMAWSPRLRDAVQAAIAIRTAANTARSRPVPLRPEDRPLIVAEDGGPLTKSGFDTAWQRMMRQAVKAGVITEEERFGLHAMKHRGITDTKGNKKDKQTAAGHKSERMTDIYDHDVPVIEPLPGAEFSGEFSGAPGKRKDA